MGLNDPAKSIRGIWKKYRYAAFILLIGIAFMLFPGEKKDEAEVVATPAIQEKSMEERLEGLLSGIEGVGRVDVLLSIKSGESVTYQTDVDTRTSENDQSESVTTVTVTQSDRGENGLVRQVDPPMYLGAVIACQGAADYNVRLSVVNAVSKATGLGADRIAVIKMK